MYRAPHVLGDDSRQTKKRILHRDGQEQPNVVKPTLARRLPPLWRKSLGLRGFQNTFFFIIFKKNFTCAASFAHLSCARAPGALPSSRAPCLRAALRVLGAPRLTFLLHQAQVLAEKNNLKEIKVGQSRPGPTVCPEVVTTRYR